MSKKPQSDKNSEHLVIANEYQIITLLYTRAHT